MQPKRKLSNGQQITKILGRQDTKSETKFFQKSKFLIPTANVAIVSPITVRKVLFIREFSSNERTSFMFGFSMSRGEFSPNERTYFMFGFSMSRDGVACGSICVWLVTSESSFQPSLNTEP